MNDEERAAVGTCYKRQGPEAALALGHKLVQDQGVIHASFFQPLLDNMRALAAAGAAQVTVRVTGA
jgi:hypothetical protein